MAEDRDEWTEDDVKKVLINPVYTGIGSFPRIIEDDQWVQANVRLLGDIGTENWLRGLLCVLRETLSEEEA